MKNSSVSSYALSFCAAAALLVGCGGSQTSFFPTSAHLAQTSASGHKDLIYVDYGTSCGSFCVSSVVNVYTFPKGRFIASWLGGNGSQMSGECADGAGNIFVTYVQLGNPDVGSILKFAHGDTSPVATLSAGTAFPVACSVDPNSGNLAVVNIINGTPTGNLMIFSNASGSPTVYRDPRRVIFYGVAYDGAGNIFVDGHYIDVKGGRAVFAEFPKGGTSFKEIGLTTSENETDEVQWDGHHITLGLNGLHNKIERLDIHGSSGHVVGITKLNHLSRDYGLQYSFTGKELVVGWNKSCFITCVPPGGVGTWSYPAGSLITKSITQGSYRNVQPAGIAVSPGQQ